MGLKEEEKVKNETLRQKRRTIAAKRLALGFNDKGKEEVDDKVIDDLEYNETQYQTQQEEKKERKPVKLIMPIETISREDYKKKMLKEDEQFKTV